MPSPFSLPPCLLDCYKVLYPNLDFSRITFYEGMPAAAGSPKGFTMSAGGPSPDINIYVSAYQPCSKDTFLTIAHELVHAVQIQGMTGGGHIPGSWSAYYLSHWLGCAGRGAKCDNELEKEAYDFADGGCSGNGQLRDFIDTQTHGALPCKCTGPPWPTPNTVGAQSFVEALKASGLVKTESRVGRTWCSLLNWPLTLIAGVFSVFGFSNTGGAWGSGIGIVAGGIIGGIIGGYLGGPLGAIIGAYLGALLGGLIGGFIGWLVDTLFSGPSARIWFTAFDGASWVIPDIPITHDGHTRTSHGPALAVFGNQLITAYKGSDSNDVWYNWFDANGWQAQDKEISQNGHTQTSEAPALAEYNGKLYMAYKGGSSTDIWYNVFDGVNWLPQDLEITQGGHTKTNKGPALAAYNGKLYMAYKGGSSNELWYNVFDGANWLAQDIKITQGGHTLTSATPALAVYDNLLYMAYKGGSSNELWYNVFDGNAWLPQDIKITTDGHVKTGRGPALVAAPPYLVLVYRDDS
jgi:hypothetical protein